jgi:hypothetical protein
MTLDAQRTEENSPFSRLTQPRPSRRRAPRLARLPTKVRAALTERAYAADWRDFLGVLHADRPRAAAAEPETLTLYLADLSRRGRKPATWSSKLAAIAVYHRAAGFEATTEDESCGNVHRGSRQRAGVTQVQKNALVDDGLRQVVGAIDPASLQAHATGRCSSSASPAPSGAKSSPRSRSRMGCSPRRPARCWRCSVDSSALNSSRGASSGGSTGTAISERCFQRRRSGRSSSGWPPTSGLTATSAGTRCARGVQRRRLAPARLRPASCATAGGAVCTSRGATFVLGNAGTTTPPLGCSKVIAQPSIERNRLAANWPFQSRSCLRKRR